jgi:hypothetical protein
MSLCDSATIDLSLLTFASGFTNDAQNGVLSGFEHSANSIDSRSFAKGCED